MAFAHCVAFMNVLDARGVALLCALVASSFGCSSPNSTSFGGFMGGTPASDAASDSPAASSALDGAASASRSGSGAATSGSSNGSSGAGGSGAQGASGSTSGSSGGGPGSSGAGGSGASGASGSSGGSGAGGSGTSGSASADGGSVWSPTPAAPIHFHWFIGGFTTADILSNQSGPVVYDIDGENSTTADVAAIHAAGATAVCYVSVGTLEKGRSDYNQFPASVIGAQLPMWPNENYLLVTAANQPIILPLMKARFTNWCQAKGFDAIEPDNLDAWSNTTGISQADNLAYDLAIAQLAHALPLSIGLKNIGSGLSGSQLSSFVAAFDWVLHEQGFEYGDSVNYTQAGSFLPAGKAVFDVEYNVSPNCTQADQWHMNAQLRDLGLVGATASGYKYTPCIPDNQSTW